MFYRNWAEGDFASALSLYHAYELLPTHGLRSFFKFALGLMGEKVNDSRNSGGGLNTSTSPTTSKNLNRRLLNDLSRIPIWSEIIADMREKFSDDAKFSRLNTSGPRLLTQFGANTSGAAASTQSEISLGHPKLDKLREIVVDHFKTMEAKGVPTRVMIFSQYRDSVVEITACLHVHRPLVKVMEFVGQAGTKGKQTF